MICFLLPFLDLPSPFLCVSNLHTFYQKKSCSPFSVRPKQGHTHESLPCARSYGASGYANGKATAITVESPSRNGCCRDYSI